ncbi:tape measure protein [Loktanella sp. 3ANDIMAR09]|uniref:tape measure protein n=1 Tax=Loktanella sp. 3ANDIMAR09 TaxID=1225657 RepID=UPI00155E4EB8|nr:tape measure protein [Loktanella sp. 3ANDIMAR09]
MIFEVLDRASRPMRQLMRLQRLLGREGARAGNDAARGSDRGARAQRGWTRAVDAGKRAQAGLRSGIERTNRVIDRQIAGLRRSGSMMGSGARNIAGAAGLATAAFAGISAAASGAAAAIIGPAAEFEKYAIQLETLEGSPAKGKEAMSWIENFAAGTNLELAEVVQAYAQMRNFGLDPTNGSMVALLDTMNAAGQGTEMLSTQILALGKAQTLGKLQGESATMLMEKGIPVYDILSDKLGKSTEQIQKMMSAGELGRDAIALLIDGMGERSAGATEKISRTWDGIISNLMDQWTRFRRMIADAGVFDHMKSRLRGFLDWLDIKFQSGDMQLWAEQVAGAILSGFKVMEAFAKWAYGAWVALVPMVQSAADAMGGYRNLALGIAAIILHGTLMRTALGLFQIGAGAAMAVRYLAGLSFAGLAHGALRFGSVLLGLLNPMNLVRGALFALRLAVISTGIGAIIVGIAMAGTWIYNNWSGLKEFFIGIGEGMNIAFAPVSGLLSPIVDGAKRLWGWFTNLLGPIDANAETWRDWGVSVGEAIAGAINWVADLPGRIGSVLSAIPGIDWLAKIGATRLQEAWGCIQALVAGLTLTWDFLRGIDWADLIGDPAAAWGRMEAWVTAKAVALWNMVPSIPWSRLLGGLRSAWDNAVGFLTNINWRSLLPDFNWADILPDPPDLGGWFETDPMERLRNKAQGAGLGSFGAWAEGAAIIERLQAGAIDATTAMAQLETAGRAGGGEWQRRAGQMRDMLADVAGLPKAVVTDVSSLAGAAEAADALRDRLPQLDQAAQRTLQVVGDAYRGIEAGAAAVDLSSDGARIGQSLAAGLLSQVGVIRAAAEIMGDVIRTTLPAAASARVTVSGPAMPGPRVSVVGPAIAGARANGGPVTKGLNYLVGERGPEIFRAPANGAIVDNARTRVAMASAATPRARPVSGGGSTTGPAISYSPTFNIKSDTPAAVRAEIEAMEAEMQDRLLTRLRQEQARAHRRRMAS